MQFAYLSMLNAFSYHFTLTFAMVLGKAGIKVLFGSLKGLKTVDMWEAALELSTYSERPLRTYIYAYAGSPNLKIKETKQWVKAGQLKRAYQPNVQNQRMEIPALPQKVYRKNLLCKGRHLISLH